MLEANAFRIMTLIAGVIVFGAVVLGYFKYPMVNLNEVSAEERLAYERVTHIEDKDHLTAFDVTVYYIKGKPRADVKHY